MAFVSRRQRWLLPSLLILLLCAPPSAFAQALRVIGDVPTHLDLSTADIAAFQRQTIRVTDEKGNPAEYAGVPVAEILAEGGRAAG